MMFPQDMKQWYQLRSDVVVINPVHVQSGILKWGYMSLPQLDTPQQLPILLPSGLGNPEHLEVMPEELCRSVTQRVTGVILEMMIKIMPG